MDEIESKSLKDEISSDQLILDAIENNDIKTIVTFELPVPLFIKDPIEFEINGIKYNLDVKIIDSPSSVTKKIGSGFVEAMEDKYGLINRSVITLTIFRYIDPNNSVEMKTFSKKEFILETLSESINALNYFIERYKIVSKAYWVETIFYKMISNFSCKIMAGDQIIRNIPFNIDQMIRSSPDIPWLTDAEVKGLNDCLKKDNVPLWKILLLNAKDYQLRRNYREAIYAINGAFENFFMIKAREKLEKSWNNEETNDYLEGKPKYENFNLKDYLSEELFIQAVSNGDIKSYVPSTYQILKKCYEIEPSKVSLGELNKLASKIRRKRNEILHGVEITENLENISFEAIKNFELFIDVF